MAAYASLPLVLARAGQFRDAWDDGTQPGFADIEQFIVDTGGILDALLGSRGCNVPVTDTVAVVPLGAANADMALQLAVEATPNLLAGSEGVRLAKAALDTRVTAIQSGVTDGSFPPLVYLLAQDTAGADGGASSYWTHDALTEYSWERWGYALTPAAGMALWTDPWGVPIAAGPPFTKGDRF